MKRIFVVCGAGASSTFLAHWMRIVASQRSEQFTVRPSSLAEVGTQLADGDVVLVGHHLESQFDAIAASAQDAGATAGLLPPLDIDATGADTALALASAFTSRTGLDHEVPEHHREPENIHG